MKLYEFYTINKISDSEIRVTPKGKTSKYYKFTKFIVDGDNLDLTLKYRRYYFEFDHEENRYCLLEIEDFPRKKSFNIENRAEMIMKNRKQAVIQYFETHLDELMNVKRFCEIEGVRSFNNIRYEIRRIMNFGGIYNIDNDDVVDILTRFGFKIGY